MVNALAEREIPGYPGVKVTLYAENGRYIVDVNDLRGTFVIFDSHYNNAGDDRRHAKDAYFHPFVYGYHTSEDSEP